ncbi:MAG: hypothetical protein A2Z16_01785 [Chloroflexi bacterium RBG_16_54_18]|nr:MAG: hypothetical protein A2Z16_01785 [Chloroflexi bacterium RBG_16_54_18]
MFAMQIPNDNDIQPENGEPEEDEIRGLEDTQAAFIQNAAERPDDGSQVVTDEINDEELMPPDGEPLPGVTRRSVRPSSEPNGISVDAPEMDYSAQTMRVAARLPAEQIPLSDTAGSQERAPAPAPLESPGKRRPRWILISVLGLFALGTIALLAGLGGYLSGISMRENAAITQVAQAAKEQYELGVDDYVQGNYFRARQRFEYVIQINPSYPGAVNMLADVLLELSTTATPTLLPTQTVVPTADLRGVEELYNQGEQHLVNGEWSQAIDAFLQLRKTNPEFRTVEIDGKLFLALRHRGRDKVLLESDLEGGIYDLTLAQRFGIMDVEGQSLLNWSTYYLTGASFWDLDWAQAAYYFGQVAPHAPNLVDKSGITARERYRVALVRYASQLLNQKQFCTAQEQLAIALTILQDPEIQTAHDQAAQLCSGVPAPGEEPTQTP